jgi:hypothetical protein
MSFITPPPAPVVPLTSPTYITLAAAGANLAVHGQNYSNGQVVNGVGSGGVMNLTSGTEAGAQQFTNALLGTIARGVRRDSANGQGCFATVGGFQPFAVGGQGAAAGTNAGGFLIEIYAGTDVENFSVASNPGWFIGLCSTTGTPPAGQLSLQINDAIGIIVDSTNASYPAKWSWIARRGAAGAVITDFSPVIVPAAAQLFALKFDCPPNSDAINFTVRRLTAPGVWATVLATTSLAGIGPATGTRVGPTLICRNFVNSGGTNGVMFNRVIAQADIYTVPHAF